VAVRVLRMYLKHLGIPIFFSACKVFSSFVVMFCTEGRFIMPNRNY